MERKEVETTDKSCEPEPVTQGSSRKNRNIGSRTQLQPGLLRSASSTHRFLPTASGLPQDTLGAQRGTERRAHGMVDFVSTIYIL